MIAANPYRSFVETFANDFREGQKIGAAALPNSAHPATPPKAPKALLMAPHPDDEMITGALPLRLMRELGFSVTDVAVTLGSRLDRREARWRELESACAYIGFRLVTPDRAGLEGINLPARASAPIGWAAAVQKLAAVISTEQPDIIFLPHAADWNGTHIGVHYLVVEAMQSLPALACHVVETEYWGAMAAPNLMIESTPADVADLVAGLSQHVGEVARNPYHLRLPGWMMDNVRRGAELVGGQGTAAPPFPFATLYRMRNWSDGQFRDTISNGRLVAANAGLNDLSPINRDGGA
jgi:LmbE family N-acetylglucosaminyl deacetylase